MPTLSNLSDPTVFEPEEIQAMSTAFELACADLHVFSGDIPGRQTIARRIIELASNGTIDAAILHKRLLAEAGVSV